MKPWALKCCGCDRLMDKDGGVVPRGTSAIQLSEVAASFDTKQEADRFAEEHGWRTADAEGINHRCPECVNAAQEYGPSPFAGIVEHRGAYVSTASLKDGV
jgi:hypothetical protein